MLLTHMMTLYHNNIHILSNGTTRDVLSISIYFKISNLVCMWGKLCETIKTGLSRNMLFITSSIAIYMYSMVKIYAVQKNFSNGCLNCIICINKNVKLVYKLATLWYFFLSTYIKAMVKGMRLSKCGDGYHLDHWHSGDRSWGAFFACVHFHHLCRFSRTVHLYHLCPDLRVKTSQGAL